MAFGFEEELQELEQKVASAVANGSLTRAQFLEFCDKLQELRSDLAGPGDARKGRLDSVQSEIVEAAALAAVEADTIQGPQAALAVLAPDAKFPPSARAQARRVLTHRLERDARDLTAGLNVRLQGLADEALSEAAAQISLEFAATFEEMTLWLEAVGTAIHTWSALRRRRRLAAVRGAYELLLRWASEARRERLRLANFGHTRYAALLEEDPNSRRWATGNIVRRNDPVLSRLLVCDLLGGLSSEDSNERAMAASTLGKVVLEARRQPDAQGGEGVPFSQSVRLSPRYLPADATREQVLDLLEAAQRKLLTLLHDDPIACVRASAGVALGEFGHSEIELCWLCLLKPKHCRDIADLGWAWFAQPVPLEPTQAASRASFRQRAWAKLRGSPAPKPVVSDWMRARANRAELHFFEALLDWPRGVLP